MAAKKWINDHTPFEIHTCAIRGMSQSQTAEHLGVTPTALHLWLRDKPQARAAWEHGRAVADMVRQDRTSQKAVADFVYRHLSPELQQVWDEAVGTGAATGRLNYHKAAERITAAGDAVRKRLFVHALVSLQWDINSAFQLCGVARAEYVDWLAKDEAFAVMLADAEYYRKNFVEQQLHNLVARQDTTAVIFANKTINRDRGYGETVAVNHQGQLNHTGNVAHGGTIGHAHAVVNLGSLDLPVDIMRAVVEAIERKATQPAPQPLKVRAVDNSEIALPPGVVP